MNAQGESANLTRHELRRAEIADTAAALFAQQGYHATSIQDLSDATGLQRGALYHYIESKQELLYRIHERFIEPLLAQALEIEAREEPADVTLHQLARVLVDTIYTYRDQVTVFLHEWRAIKEDDAWRDVHKSRRKFEAIFERTLRRGVRDGTFKISDVRLATLAFLGMINYSYHWLDPSGRIPPAKIADQFTDYFLTGIAARPKR